MGTAPTRFERFPRGSNRRPEATEKNLNVKKGGGFGAVELALRYGSIDLNDEMPYAITATPDAGYTFVNWTGTGTAAGPPS